MLKKTIRHLLCQVGLSCLAFLGYLPLFYQKILVNFLCLCLKILRFRKKTIVEHITIAFPEMTQLEKDFFVNKVYKHFASLIIEDISLLSLSQEKLLSRCKVYNLDIVEKVLKEDKKGFLALAGHIGNWELGLSALASIGYPAHAVVKEIKGCFGQVFVDAMRNKHHVGAILRSDNAGRKILATLKNAEAVGFVLDQNMTIDEGIFVDFFGKSACTMPGLAILEKRSKVPIIPIRFERTEDGFHEIWFLPPVIFNLSENQEKHIEEMTQQCSLILELMIRLAPEQWLWMHKRWRTQMK